MAETPKFDLDILVQIPSLNIYTQLCFCFALPSTASHQKIIETLSRGLERLVRVAPWIGGNVVKDNDSETYSISDFSQRSLLIVKHFPEEGHEISFEALKERKYAASLLTESNFASRMTFPDPTKAGSPVFEVQANFIPGGLIITVVGHHQAMDMVGQESIMHLFSEACHNREPSAEEIKILNLPRKDFLWPDTIPTELSKIDQSIIPTSEIPSSNTSEIAVSDSKTASSTHKSPSIWAFFNFTASALKALKDNASAQLATGFVSTDDTLSAFVWQSLTRVRANRLKSNAATKFARAVDVRRYLNVPKKYSGLMQYMSFHSRTAAQLIDEPLGLVARELRVAVDPSTTKLVEQTRQFAAAIAGGSDKSKLSFTGDLDPSSGIMLSSWASVDGYSMDFGLGLGFPDMVRRPSFMPVEGLAYLMPRTPQGDITLMLGAQADDMECLHVDGSFNQYATYIG